MREHLLAHDLVCINKVGSTTLLELRTGIGSLTTVGYPSDSRHSSLVLSFYLCFVLIYVTFMESYSESAALRGIVFIRFI